MSSNKINRINKFLFIIATLLAISIIICSIVYCYQKYNEEKSIIQKLNSIDIDEIRKKREQYLKTPNGGINENYFVDLDEQEKVDISEMKQEDIDESIQWISIYGENRDNPVLLYLHGGPCSATSYYDWGVLRKLSDVYTVVIWDQRGCGHSYHENLQFQEVSPLTKDVMMQDGIAMTNYLCDCLHKEKITLFGHSWGSIFAANLVLEHPEKYDKLIVASLVVDEIESRHYLKDYLLTLDKVKIMKNI